MKRKEAAHQIIAETLREIPEELRAAAQQVPVCIEERPGQDLLDDGLDPDILGLFVGAPRHEADNEPGAPPQIILYMENILEECRCEGTTFADEVRRTYLHELGHYLGLDEEDLAARDLD
ncbi:MAG: hypothetical protein FGM15_04850 [Chthoniobacterales bacterium]|nr:hypothetical protein [Chthoniobacterales bacterium]